MKKKYFFIIILSYIFFLQGCVPTAVLTAVVGTTATIDPRTIGTQIDDSILELRIKRALLKENKIKKNAHINVIVYKGKVLLIGQAPRLELISRAKQIAANTDGVVDVFNEIRQTLPIDLRTMSCDAWITTKVRSQLLASSRVRSSNIKIFTENNEVFLLGIVTENERNAAIDIARHVSGVKRVITAFSYIKD